MVSIIPELKRIGKSEINFSISYFYDNQWIFKLGDDLNGITYEESFSSIEGGMNALIQKIIIQFPGSDYIKRLRERSNAIFHGYNFFQEVKDHE